MPLNRFCVIQLLPPVIAKGIFWSPWPLMVTYAIQYSAIDLSISNRLSSENSSSGCAGFFSSMDDEQKVVFV